MAKPKENPALTKLIVESIVDATTGTGRSEGTIFNDTLPEGVTPEIAEQVFDHATVYAASSVAAAGQVSLAALKDNKELAHVDIHFPMGSFGYSDVRVNRERETTVPPATKGGEATKKMVFGSTDVGVTFVGGKTKVGLMGKAREAIKEEAASMFGPKTK